MWKTKTRVKRASVLISEKLSAESWRSLFLPAFSAVDWSVCGWFKWEFCNFNSAF